MSVDDTLYAPIHTSTDPAWMTTCCEIVVWIQQNRKPHRNLWNIGRPRPPWSLSLWELMNAFHEQQVREFWEVRYPDSLLPRQFEFNGVIQLASPSIPYPSYGEITTFGMTPSYAIARSIEDMNLVSNTYTHFYIFKTEQHALEGVASLLRYFP